MKLCRVILVHKNKERLYVKVKLTELTSILLQFKFLHTIEWFVFIVVGNTLAMFS